MATPDRLAGSLQVAPPPELDHCVRERMLTVLAESQAARQERGGDARATGDRAAPGVPVPVPLAERCVYALGLVGYGAHALGMLARVLWRAVLG